MSEAAPLFAIDDLVKTRPGDQGYTLRLRHLHIRQGARIALTGPSGCGKSTTLDLLGLALRPDSAARFTFAPAGSAPVDVLAQWQGGQLDALAALRLGYMGYVLQTGELLAFLTIKENMTLPARLGGMTPAEADERARKFADDLDLPKGLLSALPGALSVGQRQRAAIVRALVGRPSLILADEPTAALDPDNAQRVMDAFLKVVAEERATLVLVTHNADWARAGGLEVLSFTAEPAAAQASFARTPEGNAASGENAAPLPRSGYTAILDDRSQTPERRGDAPC